MNYSTLATPQIVQKTVAALAKNNITAELVETAKDAKKKVISLIPKGAEVMTMTSITLDQAEITQELNDSGNYASVKNTLSKMDRVTQGSEMQKLGAAPDWVVGSVHAITEDGKVLVVSNTGSQLPAYVYGSNHVVWVVSTKKIVKSIEEGLERTQDHVVPKESVRARAAYGLPDKWDTFISKTLIINREVNPSRIHIIFVNEDLGF